MSNAPTIEMAGYGKPDWCKLCESSLRAAFDEQAALTCREVIAWARGRGLSVSKPTVLKHRRHAAERLAKTQSLWLQGYRAGYSDGWSAVTRRG